MRNIDKIAAEWKQTQEAKRQAETAARRRVAVVLMHMDDGRFPHSHTHTQATGETWTMARTRYRLSGDTLAEGWRLDFDATDATTLAEATAWLLDDVGASQPESADEPARAISSEDWRWVEGYERLYQVSNKGRLKSYHCTRVHPNGRLLQTFGGKNLYVTLSQKGRAPLTVPVAKLVDAAFPPPMVFTTGAASQ